MKKSNEKLVADWIESGNKIKKLKSKAKSISKKIKKLKGIARNTKRKKMKQYSKELNTNVPKSELWFRSLYQAHNLKLNDDLYNAPLKLKFIPDVLNRSKRYVIEIDGSIHNTESQKYIDLKKDQFYLKLGLKSIRIIAFDKDSYIQGITQLLEYRKTEPTKEFILFCVDITNLNK